jgi:hypothetical protein
VTNYGPSDCRFSDILVPRQNFLVFVSRNNCEDIVHVVLGIQARMPTEEYLTKIKIPGLLFHVRWDANDKIEMSDNILLDTQRDLSNDSFQPYQASIEKLIWL